MVTLHQQSTSIRPVKPTVKVQMVTFEVYDLASGKAICSSIDRHHAMDDQARIERDRFLSKYGRAGKAS